MSATVSGPREADRAPSFEAACETHQQVLFTLDALRLYWTLNGPLTSAISVMDDKFYDPDVPLEPYCLQTEPSLIWSSVAQSPLTEPKISSVTVGVEQLDDWEDQWMELHREHAIPGLHSDEARFGPLADFDPDSDEEGPEHLLRCCHGDRPRKTKVSLTVNATEGFLTIHDYVSAVHPWLMGLYEKILQASGDLQDNVPLPSDTRLMITSYSSPDLLVTVEEERWKQDKSKEENLQFAQRIEAWERQRAQELWEQEQGW
ncbi:hypothetical protein GQ44DRAFT_633501 [Phaeosphaeriaceae sp. PMI808]|nr:hypothetical protein GQ44DRAFT_633501 [Phaeosphaeriaceae sp. PMI808]